MVNILVNNRNNNIENQVAAISKWAKPTLG